MAFVDRRKEAVEALAVIAAGGPGEAALVAAIGALRRSRGYDALPAGDHRRASDLIIALAVEPKHGPRRAPSELVQQAAFDFVGEEDPSRWTPDERLTPVIGAALDLLGRTEGVPEPGAGERSLRVSAVKALGQAALGAANADAQARAARALAVLVRTGAAADATGSTSEERAWMTAWALRSVGRAFFKVPRSNDERVEVARLVLAFARHTKTAMPGDPGHPASTAGAAHAIYSLAESLLLQYDPLEQIEAARCIVDYATGADAALPGVAGRKASAAGVVAAVTTLCEHDPLEELDAFTRFDIASDFLDHLKRGVSPDEEPEPGSDDDDEGEEPEEEDEDEERRASMAEVDALVTAASEALEDLGPRRVAVIVDFAAGRRSLVEGQPGDPQGLEVRRLTLRHIDSYGVRNQLGKGAGAEVGLTAVAALDDLVDWASGSADVGRHAECVKEAAMVLSGERTVPQLAADDGTRAGYLMCRVALGDIVLWRDDPFHPEVARARGAAFLGLFHRQLRGGLAPDWIQVLGQVAVGVASGAQPLLPMKEDERANENIVNEAALLVHSMYSAGELPPALHDVALRALHAYNERHQGSVKLPIPGPSPARTTPQNAEAFSQLERFSKGATTDSLPATEIAPAVAMFLRCANPATPVEAGASRSPLSLIGYRLSLLPFARVGFPAKVGPQALGTAAGIALRWLRQDFLALLDAGGDTDYGETIVHALTILGDGVGFSALPSDEQRRLAADLLCAYALGDLKPMTHGKVRVANEAAATVAAISCPKRYMAPFLPPPRWPRLMDLYLAYAERRLEVHPEASESPNNARVRLGALEMFAVRRFVEAFPPHVQTRVATLVAGYLVGDLVADRSGTSAERAAEGVGVATQALVDTNAMALLGPPLRAAAEKTLRALATGEALAVPGNTSHRVSQATARNAKLAVKKWKIRGR